MKRNPAQPQRAVLLYNLESGPRGSKIRAYLQQQGIHVIDVPPADDLQPLGALLELPAFPRSNRVSPLRLFREEMMVMFAMQGAVMSEFLQFFRDEGLSPVALKAVVTPTNVTWTSNALYQELCREREAFAQKRRDPS